MSQPIAHNLGTLRALLESLSRIDCRELPSKEATDLAESFRDCRLELMRFESHKLSEAQLHRLEQVDYRLQMVVSAHGLATGIASEAKRALDSFGWTTNT